MIWTLIRKEMLDQILSLRFSVSLALALLFLIPATSILATDYGWLHREMGPYIKEGFYTWGWSWYWLNRNIPTLRVLATGLDEELSLRSPNEAFSGPLFAENSNFVHNPLRYLFSQLDFVFFITTLGSLMAFAFTYDALSGERQRGTLRLMMTNPIPRPLFVVSKFLGSYLSFVITLVPALIGVILVLYLHPNVALRTDDWGATAFLFLLALLYLSAFFMLGLFVSCVTREPKTTLTALLTLWVILVLVIPHFSPFLAVKLHPVRSLHEIETQIAALRQDLRQQTEKEQRDLMQERNWDALSQEEKEAVNRLTEKYYYKLMKLSVGEGAKIRGAFINELEAQAKVSQHLSFISPSAAFVLLASDMAHTGLESERNFRRAVIRYRRQYAEHLDGYIEKTGDYNKLWNIDKKDAPPYEYRELTFSQAIAAHLPHFMVLMLYPILFFFGAQLALIRAQL